VAALALTIALGYALANTFAAWTLLRRRPGVAAAFFSAAVALTIGGVAVAYGASESVALIAAGSAVASFASARLAWVGLRRGIPWRHALRAAVGAIAALLAFAATRG
jgi:hypothetical protein